MFRFKRFAVEQDRSAMKVGTDGVLLGAWASVGGDVKYILDIGAGTGLISLMMAQRTEHQRAIVDGVEIDEASASQAMENVERSEWSDRVTIYHCDVESYMSDYKYDIIVTNPPFFVDSLLSPDAERSVARHTTSLSFEMLVRSVDRLLADDGRLSVVLPLSESKLFEKVASENFVLVRRCAVRGRMELQPKRYLSEYRRLGDDGGVVVEESLAIELSKQRGDYTAEYRELTKDYYLKF